MAGLASIASVLLVSAAVGTPTVPNECQQIMVEEEETGVLMQHGAGFAQEPGGQGKLEQHSMPQHKDVADLTSLSETKDEDISSPTDIRAKFRKCLRAAYAEFIAMTLFVIIGCGSAMGIAKEPGSAWVLQVSLSFGLAITSLAYSVGAYSGGQINCAVTLGLVLVGHVSVMQGCVNFVAQMVGSLTGAYILTAIFPKEKDKTGGLGSNGIGEGWSATNAFIGEALMTCLLMFVVLETAVNPNSEANRALACVAIGFAVFLAHTVLIPIDGCSINPTRSFGPAFVAKQRYGKQDTMHDMGIFFLAPCTGAALGAGMYSMLRVM